MPAVLFVSTFLTFLSELPAIRRHAQLFQFGPACAVPVRCAPCRRIADAAPKLPCRAFFLRVSCDRHQILACSATQCSIRFGTCLSSSKSCRLQFRRNVIAGLAVHLIRCLSLGRKVTWAQSAADARCAAPHRARPVLLRSSRYRVDSGTAIDVSALALRIRSRNSMIGSQFGREHV